MSSLLKKIKFYLFFSIIFFILVLLYTYLVYNGVISLNNIINKTFSISIGSLMILIISRKILLKQDKNGIIKGFLLGILLISIIILIKLITKTSLYNTDIIKYIIYVIFSTIGGIMGVNKN